MNIFSRKIGGFCGRLLTTAVAVWALGLMSMPALADVAVDQSPLIIQKPLPPNVTLMLDDSGSMAWDVMPDICYLNGISCSYDRNGNLNNVTVNNSAVINANNNGVYYDPTVTYTPPLKADGSSYPNASGLTSAWIDGFHTNNGSVDLTTYDGSSDSSYNIYNASYDAIDYSASATGSKTATFNNVSSSNSCKSIASQTSGATGYNYNSNTKVCTVTYNQTYNFFQYSTGNAAGPYTVRFVANSDCGGQSNCVLASDTSGVAAPSGVAAGQNIANWFAYYHTRILMAKSGLMNSFASIDATFRVGFGSINGNNAGGLPSDKSSYNSKQIANVKPFGNGSSGTQKANFWSWLVGEYASSGTPLQSSLDAVGQYYQSAQPWATSDTDSSELACRQAYTILTTDGFWNGALTNKPGNADGVNGAKVTGPNGQSYTYKAAAPYSDGNSNTLADYAMKYWQTDLRPTTDNEVPTSTEDPAFWQHMTTFTLGLGFTPTGIQPSGTTIDQIFKWANGGSAISKFSWPTPAADSINNIADLAHAALNGHGGFYSATSPQAFASGLRDALKRAAERVGTGASLAANSTQLKTGTVAYQANYYTAKWKGDLKALAVDPTTGDIATTPTWTAAGALPTAANRKIYTYNSAGGKGKQFIAFSDPATLSTAEQTALGSSTAEQQAMINYLRGDATNEQRNGGGYRNRDTALGDIVDSQPVYVGAPDPNQFVNQAFSGSTAFGTYASNNATRTALIYVAANDGMLHAFNASTGAEVFAYLPAGVITSNLKQLADPGYGSDIPHQFFNDGELTVADAYFSSDWHTVLVGTTGRGSARTVYALDITDPSSITLLWERSAADGQTNSGSIGQMSGKPVIAQVADGSWAVLIGNGYNSTAGTAGLLQFALSDGTLTVHATDTTASNGLAAPAVWLGNLANGVSTVAYAGDLFGRVWSFSLNDGTSSTPSTAGTKLFTAMDASNKAQPITAGLLVGKDPVSSNVWVYFGTGRYLSTSDLNVLDTQTWYGLIVQSTTANLVSNLSQGRSALAERDIVVETAGNTKVTPPVAPARATTQAADASSMTGKSGWYMDLTSPLNGKEGERMVTPNQFQGSLLLGTTRIPVATDLCNPSGRGWVMAVNPFTGAAPASSFFDITGNDIIDGADTIKGSDGKTYVVGGVGFSALPNNPIFVGSTMLMSFDNGSTGSYKTSGTTGGWKRVSWRELINQ